MYQLCSDQSQTKILPAFTHDYCYNQTLAPYHPAMHFLNFVPNLSYHLVRFWEVQACHKLSYRPWGPSHDAGREFRSALAEWDYQVGGSGRPPKCWTYWTMDALALSSIEASSRYLFTASIRSVYRVNSPDCCSDWAAVYRCDVRSHEAAHFCQSIHCWAGYGRHHYQQCCCGLA